MKPVAKPKYPRGWNEKKVRELIDYYDNQSEEEGAVEIETAPAAEEETWMSVPSALVPAVTRLIQDHTHKTSKGHARRPAPKTRSARPRRLER